MTPSEAYRQAKQQEREKIFTAAQWPARLHTTKTAICQIWYNRLEITDMAQRTPDGPYEVY